LVKITIKDLSFSYGSRRILDDLNFVVGDSEILLLDEPTSNQDVKHQLKVWRRSYPW